MFIFLFLKLILQHKTFQRDKTSIMSAPISEDHFPLTRDENGRGIELSQLSVAEGRHLRLLLARNKITRLELLRTVDAKQPWDVLQILTEYPMVRSLSIFISSEDLFFPVPELRLHDLFLTAAKFSNNCNYWEINVFNIISSVKAQVMSLIDIPLNAQILLNLQEKQLKFLHLQSNPIDDSNRPLIIDILNKISVVSVSVHEPTEITGSFNRCMYEFLNNLNRNSKVIHLMLYLCNLRTFDFRTLWKADSTELCVWINEKNDTESILIMIHQCAAIGKSLHMIERSPFCEEDLGRKQRITAIKNCMNLYKYLNMDYTVRNAI